MLCNLCKFALKCGEKNIYCGSSYKEFNIGNMPSNCISSPEWCPLEKKVKENEHEVLTYTEKIDRLKNIKFIDWADIKVGETYHIPQIPGIERMDIKITAKNQFFCEYTKCGEKNHVILTFFPRTLFSQFLMKKTK